MMVNSSPRKSKVPNILGDWDDVRFFLAVAKTGSFSAAATQLNTKQTTVGRRIQALERRLGAKLFDRHRHGMEVTPAARGVLVQAESMLSNATSIERHLAGLDREMAGVVRSCPSRGTSQWAAIPSVAAMRTMPAISRSRPARCRSIEVALDIIDSAWTSTPRAAGVTSMPWRCRSNSLAPSRRSSAWMRRPTVVCLVFSCVAAALKLPVFATARKKRTSSQSPRMFGTLFFLGGVVTIVTIDTIRLAALSLL